MLGWDKPTGSTGTLRIFTSGGTNRVGTEVPPMAKGSPRLGKPIGRARGTLPNQSLHFGYFRTGHPETGSGPVFCNFSRFYGFLFGGWTMGGKTFPMLSYGNLCYFRSYGSQDPLGPLLGLKFGSSWVSLESSFEGLSNGKKFGPSELGIKL
jgi:hypothetical protein